MSCLPCQRAIVIGLVLLMAGLSSSDDVVAAPPTGYQSHCLALLEGGGSQSKKRQPDGNVPAYPAYLLRGYGVGSSFSAAKHQALKELASQIHAQVRVEEDLSMQGDDEKVTTRFNQQAHILSEADLQGAKSICRDHQDPGGQVHVVYQWDLRPPEQQLSSRFKQQWQGRLPRSIKWQGSALITESLAATKLYKLLTDADSAIPQRRLKIGLTRSKAARSASGWQINVDNQVLPLRSHDLINWINWSAGKSVSALQLQAVKINNAQQLLGPATSFRAGDLFMLRLSGAAGAKGMATVFNVYADGRVSQLGKSIAMAAGQALLLPQQGVFESQLLNQGESVRDWYIAVLTRKPVTLQNFQQLQADRGVLDGSGSYQLDHFIHWVSSDQVEAVSSLVMVTFP